MGMEHDVVMAFLLVGEQAASAVSDPEVAAAWELPSALELYTVGGLAGHTARAVLTVDRYIAAPEPPPDAIPIGPADYVAQALGDDDPIGSAFHEKVRLRGVEAATSGPDALSGALRHALDRLREELPHAIDENRRIGVLNGMALYVEDYLATRLLELVIHLDDLAVSVGRPGVATRPEILQFVAGLLGQIAATRGDGLEVVRGLARRERHPEAIRAL